MAFRASGFMPGAGLTGPTGGSLGSGHYLDPYDHPMRDQAMTAVPAPAFPAFRFEPKRARIDWRLLHGVDINSIVSDLHNAECFNICWSIQCANLSGFRHLPWAVVPALAWAF